MKLKISFVFSLFFITSACFSQTSRTFLDEQDWRIIPGYSSPSNTNPMKQSTGDFGLGKVVISPTETAAIVSYKKKDYGVILINNNLNVKWNIPINGVPLAIAKFHDDLLVIVTPKISLIKGIAHQLNGILIDPAKGEIVLTKDLLSYGDDVVMDIQFLINSNANDFKIGLRTTQQKKQGLKIAPYGIGLGKMIRQAEENYQKSDDFQVISFKNDLSEDNRINFPVKKEMRLMQFATNNDGEIFTLYFDGTNNITVEKYDANGINLLGTRSFSFNAKNRTEFNSQIFVSKVDPSIIYIGIDYTNDDKDYSLDVYRVDFSINNNSVPSAAVVIDKDYRKAAEASYVSPDQDIATKPETKKWDNMQVVDVLDTKDKVIVFKEVSYSLSIHGSSNAEDYTVYITGDAIVSIYSKQMQLLSEQVIPKEMETNFEIGVSSSLNIRDDNKLSIISVSDKKNRWGDALYSEIDLSTNKLTKYVLLKRSSTDRKELPDPKSTIWFSDGFEINYLLAKGIGITDINTYPEKFNY